MEIGHLEGTSQQLSIDSGKGFVACVNKKYLSWHKLLPKVPETEPSFVPKKIY
jgi:hypothetical protein